ncbi:DHH family phosphoesterase [Alkalihalobacillus sp. LMS6]|uniref:DHH family phosphoesterase n=1 Tax=Alkalihalobacillus sp. LMS6 TaxID=2924034 RepID=UPI0020D0F2FD|nr:DHH family phosphoesterase [Alkalihalobacillus sp. LMS6]UTR06471.1 DHH family phosphoesterase [Alkalihalobacillus sp. LMS6]
MPNWNKPWWQHTYVITLFVLVLFLTTWLMFNRWEAGLLVTVLLLVWLFFYFRAKKKDDHYLDTYISTLSYRVNKASDEAITKLPVGIVLYNESGTIQWTNPFIQERFGTGLNGLDVKVIHEDLQQFIQGETTEETIQFDSGYYHFTFEQNERLIYVVDVTEKETTQKRYDHMLPLIAHIYLDNYDEVTQSMDDQIRSRLLAQVTTALNNWANDYDIYLRRTSSDRFLAVMNHKTLLLLEENRFELLDEIREITAKEKAPITLSIGVGTEEASLKQLGVLAQSSLDLALGRGGDQVAIKKKNGRVRFYGGKTNAVEKRTRVRARVISHALRDFVKESEKVIVMGHNRPDMDAIGASIGVLKLADLNDREGFIVLDEEDTNADVQRLLDEVKQQDHLWNQFVSPEEAIQIADKETLLIIVDTHKPSMVIEPKLLQMVDRIIVLDHHRRSEDFVHDPVLVYMEPYASSTAELVTELLEYQPMQFKMDRLEATALLAGITVDTKSFAVRTGARTFDAASFLRANGADTALVQKLLKEDLGSYVRRAKLMENAYVYRDGYAIAMAKDDEPYDQIIIAQAADTLLTMSGVRASFVVCKRGDGRVGISARSLGDINVQVIMERLGGGGHLSNAATQLEETTREEVKDRLEQAIDEGFEGGTER